MKRREWRIQNSEILRLSNMNKDRVLIFQIGTSERTISLSLYAINQLGFKNVVSLIDPSTSFYEKLRQFIEHSYKNINKYDFFIKTDADEIIFEEINELINFASKNKELRFIEGLAIDKFMKKPRGGGPKLYTREGIIAAYEAKEKIVECKKPESDLVDIIVEREKRGGLKAPYFMCLKQPTCLHEYEQLPSKVCNSFINRLKRNHSHLYDLQKLTTEESLYKISFLEGIKLAREIKRDASVNVNSSNFIDLSYIDDMVEKQFNFNPIIRDEEIENMYLKLKKEFKLRNFLMQSKKERNVI